MGRAELLLVAWDGVPPGTISRLLGEGALPSLRDLLGDAPVFRVRSTVPPITAPAWASFHLGVNPGKHGILDFIVRAPGRPPRPVSSRDLPYPTFWEVLAEAVPVGVIGFPLGYPARPLARGFWIPGFLAPRSAASFPREAMAVAREAGYPLDPPAWFPGGGWVEELKRNIRAKTEASLALYRRYRPLVLGVHYQETDTVQHFLWGDPAVDEVLAAADEGLGRLAEGLSPRAVLLLSDHGMGPLKWDFHLNTWLLREGLLSLRAAPPTRMRRVLFDLGLSPRAFQGLGERSAALLRRAGVRPSLGAWWRRADCGRSLFLSHRDVDWRRTAAYSPGGMGTISLNGGRPCSPAEVAERLRELRSPDGEPAVEAVFPREEIYRGERAGELPDLVFLTRGMEILPVSSSLFLSHRIFSPPSVPAHHRMYGFLAANAYLGLYDGMNIWEIAPRILSHFGVAPPDHMDLPSR